MSFIRKSLGEYIFILIVLLMGVSTSIWLFNLKRNYDKREIQASFNVAADERFQAIHKSFSESVALTDSLVAFFDASQFVSRQEFDIYVKRMLLNFPYVRFAGWVPYVKANERSIYEIEGRKFFPGFNFQELSDKGLSVSKPHDEYFPFFYAQPDKYLGRFLGFDINSSPPRLEALERARSTKKIAVSGKIATLADKQVAIVFFEPVYKKNAQLKTTDELTGFVSVTIPIKDIIALAIKQLTPVGTHVIIHDLTGNSPENEPILISSSRIIKNTDEQVMAGYFSNKNFKKSNVFEVAGRKWQITILAANGQFELKNNNDAYVILAFGIILSSLISFYMFTRLKQNERINKTVQLRTQELTLTKKEIELILNSTTDGIIGLDASGKVIFCNPISLTLLGFQYGEMIGNSYRQLFYHTQPDKPDAIPAIENILANKQKAITISDEVFWRKDGDPLQVEYTASAIVEDNKPAGAVIIFRDITRRKLSEQRMEQMAHYDQLTDLVNRGLFFELLKKAIARTQRAKTKLGIIYIDLDNFKPVNDTMGHAAGDLLLKLFSQRIKSALREYDVIARLGGDEFAILGDNLNSAEECAIIVERILKLMEKPFDVNGETVTIKFSTGIAIYPDDAIRADELISAADSAMYRAKKDKSLRYFFYSHYPSP